MNSLSSIALSGLNAAQLRLDSAAHNMANLQTGNFRQQEVVQQSVGQGGVTASVQKANVAGEAMAADIVQTLSAKHAYLANLKVLQTDSKLKGRLLDERA